MKKLLFAFLLFASPCMAQTTYPAAGCSQAQVAAAIATEQASKVDGDIITIPAGTCTWTGTQQITQNFTNSVTIQGAGALSSTAGGSSTTGSDSTVLIDNVNNSANNLLFQLTGVAGKTIRVTGIAFESNSGSFVSNQPFLTVNGPFNGTSFLTLRVDHCHFVLVKNGSGQVWSYGLAVFNYVIGVADHNYWDSSALGSSILTNDLFLNNGIGWNSVNDPNGTADSSWADGDHFGTQFFFYLEDSRFVNNDVGDCHGGGRYVLRYSTIVTDANEGQLFNHGTAVERPRGCRATEVYHVTVTHSVTSQSPLYDNNSGPALVWGNTGTNAKSFTDLGQVRINNDVYQQSGGTVAATWGANTNWGYSGPTPIATGTASVSANSTAVTGSGFSTSWPAGSMFILKGASCTSGATGYTGQGSCRIASVTNSTTLTLQGNSTLAVVSGAYEVGSPWDGNVGSAGTVTGYPSLDGPARGGGDLLNGATFSAGILDTVTGTQTFPSEPLDPLYTWDNTVVSGISNITTSSSPFTDNRDYYQQCGTPGESCGGGFNGTVGIGQGLLSARPVTCTAGSGGNTPGVGYWGTDTNTLYVCNPTNTWTTYYTPYTYPNPLTGASSNPVGTQINGKIQISGKVQIQ